MGLFGDKRGKQLTEYTNKILDDDVLTEDEEKSFLEYATSLGVKTLDKYPAR